MRATLGIDTGVKVKPSFTVGGLAARTSASPRSIRHYDAHGLLPSSRDANGYRRFGEEAVGAVARIRALLDAGYALDLVARLLACTDDVGALELCPEVAAQMRAVLARKEDDAARLAAQAARIRAHLAG